MPNRMEPDAIRLPSIFVFLLLMFPDASMAATIFAAPQILSPEWMLIGRQESMGFGGRVDLLAIAPDGALVLIEIKRDRTPREVVAQVTLPRRIGPGRG